MCLHLEVELFTTLTPYSQGVLPKIRHRPPTYLSHHEKERHCSQEKTESSDRTAELNAQKHVLPFSEVVPAEVEIDEHNKAKPFG